MGERLFITFALTGRSSGFYVTQGVALGLELAGPSARAWPPQYSPPSLCEQSELQCFAPGLRQMFAQRPLQLGCSKLKYQVDEDYAEKASSAALRGLKAQQVHSPGQRPGYQCINACAL